MRNRTFIVLVGFAFFLTVLQPVLSQPADSAAITLSIPDASVSVGSETKAPINIRTGGKGLGALQFDLTYDPGLLAPLKVDPGRLLSGLVDFNITSPGHLRVAVASGEAVNGEGEILVASFRGIAEGQSNLRIENARAWEQATSFETRIDTEPGLVTVAAPFPFPTMVVLVALAGLLLVGVVAILVARRKRRATAASHPPETAAKTYGPAIPPPAAGEQRCSACGRALVSGSRFCPSCGATVAASVHCPSCGKEHGRDAHFCRACGAPLREG